MNWSVLGVKIVVVKHEVIAWYDVLGYTHVWGEKRENGETVRDEERQAIAASWWAFPFNWQVVICLLETSVYFKNSLQDNMWMSH